MRTGTSYIICVNDSIGCAINDDLEYAKEVMKARANVSFHNQLIRDREEYNNIYYWHIHEVPTFSRDPQ